MAKQIKMMFACPVTVLGADKTLSSLLYALTSDNQMYARLTSVNIKRSAAGDPQGAYINVAPSDSPNWVRVPDIPDDI